jgi:flagellar hook-associated protein 1
MATGIFNIALSGLNAAQMGLLTTSHNISNASTPGFNRQQILQSTVTPMFTGSGFIGQGTNVETVQRVYNQFLSSQLLSAQTGAAEMASYQAQIDQIDNMLADSNAGLSPALADFFKGVNAVAANPSDMSARQSMLSASQALVSRFQSIDQRLQEIRDGVNSQVGNEVSAINSYAQQIAQVNQKIVLAQAATSNQPPNDLLDQRDQLVSLLNKEIRVTTVTQSDGTFSVFIGNGEPLVVGSVNYTMQAAPAVGDPGKMVVSLVAPSGAATVIPESQITGGTLGGLVSFRSQTLDLAQNSLGRIALTLAQNFNDQHRLGQDLTGALGGNYFDISLAGPTVLISSHNTGTGAPTATVASVGNLTTSDYQLTYNGGGNYTLIRLSDNAVLLNAAALPLTVDGLTFAAAGAPNANDSFIIQPTRAAAANVAVAITDPRAIAAAAPIRTGASLANTGKGSIDAGSVNGPPPPNANIQHSVTVTFNTANNFSVFDNTSATLLSPVGGIAYNPANGATVTYNGWTVHLSGAAAALDTFTIDAHSAGVADNRNMQLLGALQTQNTMAGGTASYQSAYAQLVGAVGTTANQVKVTGQAQQTLADQAQTSRDQVSGVNLDEEAANLLRYQQAYQASAKIFDIAGKLFDQILAMGG